MKNLIIALVILLPILENVKACTIDEAYQIMDKVDPFFDQMAGKNLIWVGHCDDNGANTPCCAEIGFETEQGMKNVEKVFPNNLNLFGTDIKFSFGEIYRRPLLSKQAVM